MPELPEVETIRSALAPHLTDQTITNVTVREPRLRRLVAPELFRRELTGAAIAAVRRRGKFLLIELANIQALVIHLGMTGTLRMEPRETRARKHDHIVWSLSGGRHMVFNDPRRFGMVSVQPLPKQGGDPPGLDGMGPEPLGDDFNDGYAYAKTRNRRQPVKNLLLDQRFVAGIGNIYASEALWRAEISPRRQACNISRRKWFILTDSIKKVLREAIAAGGTTIRDYRTVDGTEGKFTACLDVYNRENGACSRCGASLRIRRIVMAGRSTYYCPGCQR